MAPRTSEHLRVLLRSQSGETAGYRRAFMQINIYALMITLFLSLGALTA